MIVIAICGGRDFVPSRQHILVEFLRAFGLNEKRGRDVFGDRRKTMFVHGGCRGVDVTVGKYLESRGYRTKAFIPDWEKHGNAAGPIRNAAMAAEADLLWAWPGGEGTESCVRIFQRAGIPVITALPCHAK